MMKKPVPLSEMMARQTPEAQAAIRDGAEQIVREFTLRQIREAVKISQQQLATTTGSTQARVSRAENAESMNIEALARHIAGLGGKLRLTVDFPDRPTVALTIKGKVAKDHEPNAPTGRVRRQALAG